MICRLWGCWYFIVSFFLCLILLTFFSHFNSVRSVPHGIKFSVQHVSFYIYSLGASMLLSSQSLAVSYSYIFQILSLLFICGMGLSYQRPYLSFLRLGCGCQNIPFFSVFLSFLYIYFKHSLSCFLCYLIIFYLFSVYIFLS